VDPVSTGAQPLPHRARWPHRRLIWLLAGLAAAAGLAVGIDRAFFASSGAEPTRPALQRILDQLVRRGDAPGATAYVVGAGGTWLGSAGVADVRTHTAMPPDARMRIESNSKTWLAALILQLAGDNKLTLDDTVARWLPGLLRANGELITIRQLLHDSSGLIDDNDIWQANPKQLQAYFARVGDPALHSELLATAAHAQAHPFAPISPMLFIRLAAWQPLVATPGTTYHHSNIGWNVAGLIAEKAGGKPLPTLYRERIFEPLGLEHTAFSPQGPIAGQHAHGYAAAGGRLVDTTTMHPGKFSDGAIVTNAQDEAAFLRGAMRGALFDKASWVDLYGLPATTTCGSLSYAGEGAGDGYRSYVWFDTTGDHVAVLLVNRNRADHAAAAARSLYCGA
jgi:D-alanyl-D-alanine carboxypeptidase